MARRATDGETGGTTGTPRGVGEGEGASSAATERLTVERLAYGPDAVAHRADGKAVFVAGGVPGDVVLARTTSSGRSFDRAEVVEVLEPSPDRVAVPPEALGHTGCPWAGVSRPAQLAAKRACVVDALVRIGHLGTEAAAALVAPCVELGEPWHYRNKVELAVDATGRRPVVGVSDAHGRVVRVKDDPLLDRCAKGAARGVSGALGYLLGSRGSLGLVRVGIRASRRTGDLEVALWGEPGAFPRAQAAKVLGDAVHTTSVVRVLERGPAKARRVVGVERLSGRGFWEERVGEGRMRLSAPSFFQVSTAGAERLVELVMDGLDPQEGELAWDLYSGAGTFTLPLAHRAAGVLAVESYGPAVRDLRRNVELAGLDNVDVTGGDAAREMPEEPADVVVVDPPRAGLAPEVVDALSEGTARAVAYVSCDPATLARDLARFAERGSLAPVSVTPVDLFPQTFHVETVTLLSRA